MQFHGSKLNICKFSLYDYEPEEERRVRGGGRSVEAGSRHACSAAVPSCMLGDHCGGRAGRRPQPQVGAEDAWRRGRIV